AMEKATQEMMAKANNPKGGPGAPPANPFAGNPIGNALGSVLGLATGVAYPCVVLYILMLPRIRRAFAIANGDLPPESAEPEDYRDPGRDDFERRMDRPRDEPPPDGPDDTRFRARPDQ